MKTSKILEQAFLESTPAMTSESRDDHRHSIEQSAPNANTGLVNPPIARLAYSIKEVAVAFGVSEKSVRRLIDRGKLRPSRALRHLRIPKKEVERFLDETLVQ